MALRASGEEKAADAVSINTVAGDEGNGEDWKSARFHPNQFPGAARHEVTRC
jgi:hypothetical protein